MTNGRSEHRLARLLERMDHVRRYYEDVDIRALKAEIQDIGNAIAIISQEIKAVFSVGFPNYAPNSYVPGQLKSWFSGKLGHVLNPHQSLEQQIVRAYDVAREDGDIYIVVECERDFTDVPFGHVQQTDFLHGDGKIFDIKTLDMMLRKRAEIGLHAYEDPDKNCLVIDQTILPADIWQYMQQCTSEWKNREKWGLLGVDIMFSMETLYAEEGYDFVDAFRHTVISGQPGATPTEKIAMIQFLPETAHADLLEDDRLYTYWERRMLRSYHAHEERVRAETTSEHAESPASSD
jgi:hypothetical protein